MSTGLNTTTAAPVAAAAGGTGLTSGVTSIGHTSGTVEGSIKAPHFEVLNTATPATTVTASTSCLVGSPGKEGRDAWPDFNTFTGGGGFVGFSVFWCDCCVGRCGIGCVDCCVSFAPFCSCDDVVASRVARGGS